MTLNRIDKINQYYLSTAADYQEFWVGERDLAMHFGYYDNTVKSHSQSLEKMNEVLAKLVGISSEDRVLDAGCGFGGTAIWLAENIGCQVEGVNLVNEQLEIARQAAIKYSLSHLISFSRQDYLVSTFPDASFSVIWALETVVHNKNKDLFFAEAYRLLNKGGHLLLVEYMLTCALPVSSAEKKRLEKLESGWALSGVLTPDQYLMLLNNAGFTDIQFYDLTENVRQSVKRLGNISREALPHAKIKFATGEWNRVRYKNVVASIEMDEMFNEEMLKYIAIRARKL